MKKVLIVLGKYIQQTEPNGICMRKIMEEWTNKVEAHIISMESERQSNLSFFIHPVYYSMPKNTIAKIFFKIRKFIFAPVAELNLVNHIRSEITNLCSTNSFDAVIAVMNPAEAVEAVYRSKKIIGNGKFILYEIDPASNRYKTPKGVIQKYWLLRTKHWERKIYSSADSIIHMKSHQAHYSSPYYSEFRDKTTYMDIPGVYSPLVEYEKAQHEVKILLYSGAFYPKLREPNFMLESLRDIPKNNYKLVIYTGQMHNKICFLADKIDLNYSLHPLVPQKDIEKITAEADILLSVGNKDSDFLPSKILSYIATGKPIIHYYFDESDVSLPYLKKYNNSLLICMSEQHDEVTKKIKEFIDTASTLQMSFSQIASAFAENTPKYTSQELYQIIGGLN